MDNNSMIYPTLAIERLNTVMLTYYSDEIDRAMEGISSQKI